MALSSGTKLGPYEIQSLLGAGGMGEVYRAHDSRLNRTVAIKVLPASFSADQDRMQRFSQEARAAAALNHPNILSIFDIGEQDIGDNRIALRRLRVAGRRDVARAAAERPAFLPAKRLTTRCRSRGDWRRRTKRASSIAT